MSESTSNVRVRKPRKVTPVSGSCRWVRRLVLNTDRPGIISITSHTQAGPVTAEYEVTAHMHGAWVLGYRLTHRGSGDVYDIDATDPEGVWACDCRDWLTRRDPSLGMDPSGKGCKHVLAMKSVHAGMLRLV